MSPSQRLERRARALLRLLEQKEGIDGMPEFVVAIVATSMGLLVSVLLIWLITGVWM